MFVDTHCHIHDARFDSDRTLVLQRARESGISKMISIGCDLETTRQARALSQTHQDIYFSAGYHPHEAKSASPENLAEIKKLALHKKCVAIGECGLDYHYDHSPREVQQRIFAEQIRLAKELRKTLVVHVRDAFDDCFKLLDGFPFSDVPVVIHCFTGSLDVATRFIELGCTISISGIATFKEPGQLHEVISMAPLSQLLIETDAPYLAPLPYRGKRNEPSYIVKVAEIVAQLKSLTLNDAAQALTDNSVRVFKLGRK